MKNKQFIKQGATAVALAMILGISAANAAEVYLRAEAFTKTIPDGSGVDGNGTADVTMWGYAECTATTTISNPFDNCGTATSPGPQINVPVGDSLTVHLSNGLPEASSIMIAGQANAPLPPSPTRVNGRVQSFVPEVASGAVGTYEWATPRPGAFLYQSGSHVQLQVQMGLYGAMVMDSVCTDPLDAQCAYPDVAYDAREVLIFSEIDPALHNPAPTPANASKDGYVPRFFLINGEPFSGVAPSTAAGVAGDNILLSMINAGLENLAPQLLGGYLDVIAEDGRLAPTHRSQTTILLPAGKSQDVLFQPTVHGNYPLFDRRLRTVSDTALNSGMFTKIQVMCAAPCVDFSDPLNATVSYGGPSQDVDQNVTVIDPGFGIQLAGNTWRRTMSSFDINANTVLEFTFEVGGTVPAEIQGIGFDVDDALSQPQIFRLAGTQAWGNGDFSYTGPGPQTFTIPVGEYYQGMGMHLVFANDHDAGVPDSIGTFTNVRIFDVVPDPAPPVISDPGNQSARVDSPVQFAMSATDVNIGDTLTFSADVLPTGVSIASDGTFSGTPTSEGDTIVTVTVDDGTGLSDSVTFTWTIVPACVDCIDFATATTSSFPPTGQDIDSDVTVVNSGIGLRLARNTWRATDATYDITATTVLEFTFEGGGTVPAEIQGIGFDADTALSPTQIFQIAGTQAWGNAAGGSYSGTGKQFFSIPVGTFYTGFGMKLVFVNDHDARPSDSSGTFSDVRVVTP